MGEARRRALTGAPAERPSHTSAGRVVQLRLIRAGKPGKRSLIKYRKHAARQRGYLA